jgi:glutaredoxin 3
MSQPCSCQCGPESELKLANGKTIGVRRLRDTFLEFQAMGMPANEMVGEMLAQRIQAVSPLAESERPLYRAALLREYTRLVQARQGGDSEPRRETTKALPPVEIYSKPTCPYTRSLKRKLEHDRVIYVEYDVQSDPAKLKLMLELNGGQRNVPTVRQGDQITVGFHGH